MNYIFSGTIAFIFVCLIMVSMIFKEDNDNLRTHINQLMKTIYNNEDEISNLKIIIERLATMLKIDADLIMNDDKELTNTKYRIRKWEMRFL